MKALSIIALCALLQGCYQAVNQHDIYRAIIVCKSVDKIVHINANFIGEEIVVCQNGKRDDLSNVNSPE